MSRFLIATIAWIYLSSGSVFAQAMSPAEPTPGATSPLGMSPGSPVPPTGLPLGSTEIASPGISPAPAQVTGTVSVPVTGTTCETLGTSPTGTFQPPATYDGGGMAIGATMPATAASSGTSMPSGMSSSGISATSGMSTTSGMLETSGMSGMCGSGSRSIVSSSTPTSTSPTTPGGAARTGLPMGSTEIGNLGVSPMIAPSTGSLVGPTPVGPTLPMVSSPSTTPSSSSTTPATIGSTQSLSTTVTPGG
jgi:hypothetical protein